MEVPISSELSLDRSPLNLLSPRRLPNPGLLSVELGWEAVGPSEKLPNVPIGEKLAVCDADGHGELTPPKPPADGLVVLRRRDPKGEARSGVPSRLSLSLSSNLVFESRKSVFRRRREGGGVEVVDSSRKKREPLAVGDMEFAIESPVSRRLVPGRFELGDDVLKEFMWFCE